MKIDNPLLAQVSTGGAQQTGGVTPTQGGVGGRSRLDAYSDRVQLSNLSSALRGLGDLEADDPSRVSQVQQIGLSVQSGSYQINPAQISQKIVAESVSESMGLG